MQILDQYGNPIKKDVMTKIYNQGLYLGLGGWASALGTYLNPDQIGVPTYQQMYLMDDACRSAVRFVMLGVIARLGEYTHPNPKIQQAVRTELKRVKRKFYRNVAEMVDTGLQCGFSLGELVISAGNDGIHLNDIQWLNPAFIQFDIFTEGPLKNRVKGARQLGSVMGSVFDDPPPMWKFLHFAHDDRYGNPYGNSIMQAMYPPYWLKKGMLAAWALTLEQYGTPQAIAKILEGAPDDVALGNGERVNIYDFLERVLTRAANGFGLIIPDKIEITRDRIQGDIGKVFYDIINYCDQCIYRAALIPGLAARENSGAGGSRALGDTHFSFFENSEDFLTKSTEEVLIDGIAEPFIRWNYGPQEDNGSFQKDELDIETTKAFSEAHHNAITDGYLDMSRIEDCRFCREKIGAPDISDEEWSAMQAEKQAKEAELQERLDTNRRALEEQQRQKPTPELQKPKQAAFSRVNGLESFFAEV